MENKRYHIKINSGHVSIVDTLHNEYNPEAPIIHICKERIRQIDA